MHPANVSIIFRKELVDILRDRRTLIAMVVVPILLYPVLMLGSIQAAQFQSGRLQQEKVLVAVPSEDFGHLLRNLLGPAMPQPLPAPATVLADEEEPANFEIQVCPDPEAAVRAGAVHVGVVPAGGRADWTRWEVECPFALLYDSAEVRSEMGRVRLERLLERRRSEARAARLETLPPAIRELLVPQPIPVENVASPEKVGGSLLGHVLPLILALMTITGAVYPAIDLTAGERERGTLETLMVAPVPVIDLIAGKFLVVAAVSMIAATLNLASIGLTLRFGDVQELLAQGQNARIPFTVLPIILVAMVPFSILFSAVLIAVASFARTFKEAQNYVMPVIMAALIPATAGALPGVELRGVMIVLPVANMVLLTRELLLSHFANWPAMLVAVGSTCFYAVVAVVAAAQLFGQEAVLFAEAGSWKTLFRRRLFPPRPRPTATHVLLYTAILFPVWFHLQGRLGDRLGLSAALIVLFFGLLPVAAAQYLKIDLVEAFSLRGGNSRAWLGALLIGLGSWILAYELLVLQSQVLPVPEGVARIEKDLVERLAAWPLPLLLLALAVVPGICEELTFRGFVLSGLRSSLKPAWAIVAAAVCFAAFHFLIFRFAVSAALGGLLGYVCWRSASIGPAMLVHAMHNAWLLMLARTPPLAQAIGVGDLDGRTHLPSDVVAAGAALVLAGLVMIPRGRRHHHEP